MHSNSNTNSRRPHSGHRRGSVLLMALVVSSVVILLCAGLVTMVHRSNEGMGHASDTKEAFHVAEAGLAEAFVGLTFAKSGNVGSPENPARFGDGLFWVEARELGGTYVELESTGMVGSGRATVELLLNRAEEQIGALGFFSNEDLVLSPGSFVDGYDSRLGSYAQQEAAGQTAGMGRVGSNGNIILESGVLSPGGSLSPGNDDDEDDGGSAYGSTIDGDATPGSSGSVALQGSSSVSGSMVERSSDAVLPHLKPPGVTFGSPLVHSDAVPLMVPAGDQSFESIEIGPGAEIILTGPATVTAEHVRAQANGRLLLDTTGGPIDLIVTEEVDFQPNSRFETISEDTTLSSLLVSAEDELGGPAVMLNAVSQFHGSISAPNVSVRIGSEFELFGALAAKHLSFGPGVKLHFDHALADPSLDDANRPRIVSWRVIDIPLEVNNRALSPFDVLGVVKSDLVGPAAAHEDQWLAIEYVDKNGAVQSYYGWESGFDLTRNASTVDAKRNGEDVIPAEELKTTGGGRDSPNGAGDQGDQANQGLLAAIADPAVAGTELKELVIANSPVEESVLDELIVSSDLTNDEIADVLIAQGKLGNGVMMNLMRKHSFPGDPLVRVLLANSPLHDNVLRYVLDGTAILDPTQVDTVVAAQ